MDPTSESVILVAFLFSISTLMVYLLIRIYLETRSASRYYDLPMDCKLDSSAIEMQSSAYPGKSLALAWHYLHRVAGVKAGSESEPGAVFLVVRRLLQGKPASVACTCPRATER